MPHSSASSPPSPKPSSALVYIQLFIIFLIFICDSFSFSTLMPYIVYMVKDFKVASNKDDTGYYVGMLASSYFLAQFISSFLWGTISDKLGQKRVILFGIGASIFTNIFFGLSTSFWLSIAIRSCFGLLNGNLPIYKSLIGDLCKQDAKLQGRAFTLITLANGLGYIIGPSIGGALARPVQQYRSFFQHYAPNWLRNWLLTFPYFLPNAVVALCLAFGFCLGVLYLQDTKKQKPKKRKQIQEKQTEPQTSSLLPAATVESGGSGAGIQALKEQVWTAAVPLLVSTIYALHGVTMVLWNEIFPLYASEPMNHSGLGFTPFQIGISGSILGLVAILLQLLVCGPLLNRFGALMTFRWSIFLGLPVFIVFPLIARLYGAPWPVILRIIEGKQADSDDDDPALDYTVSSAAVWMGIIVCFIWRFFVANISFMSCSILINNSVSVKNLGKVNGIAQSIASLLRAIAPTLGSSLFAWSLSNKLGYPFDISFVYWIMFGVQAVMLFCSLLIPKSLVKESSAKPTTTNLERKVAGAKNSSVTGGEADEESRLLPDEQSANKDV